MATVEQAIGRDKVRKALKRYEPKPTDRHSTGLVREIHDDGSFEVLLPGAVETTKCANYCSAIVGDVVAVVIRADGSCAAIGRLGGDIGGGSAVVTYNDASNYIAGRVFAYAGTDEPIGALPCDGRAVSRTVYWELFAAIGTTYGAGDGSSTFNLPNIESRTIIGESDSYALGSTGGEERHTLTVDEMPNHEHWMPVYDDDASTTTIPEWTIYAAERWTTSGMFLSNGSAGKAGNRGSTGFGMSWDAGGDQPHNIMQPYVVMRYFITTGKADNPASGINPADYVVEWGDTGIWTWRKYASGIAECWGKVDYTTESSFAVDSYVQVKVDLPFEFASRKPAIVTNSTGAWRMRSPYDNASGSVFPTQAWLTVFFDAATGSGELLSWSVYVSGTWKSTSSSGGTESIAPTIESRFEALEAMLKTETIEITSYASGWTKYSDKFQPTLKVCGKVVTLTGAMTPTAEVYLGSSQVEMFYIPKKYAPSQVLELVCQGSSINRWEMAVGTEGSVVAARYGTEAYSNAPAGAWFPFHATWIID